MFSRDLCFSTATIFITWLLLVSSNNLSAQKWVKIKGSVLTEANYPISDANLILRSKLGVLISFKSSDKNGDFVFDIKDNSKEFIIETSYLGFQKDSQAVSFKDNAETVNLLIVLKATITSLTEIKIAHKPAAIYIKNDTTTYKVSSFLNGGEEVVEDVLKRLPGLEVSENGKITYKGKSISKVLIEGDDLFSKDYQIGTKNLKSGILDEVQAIENYVENEKLVGLKRTNETVLNLKIKDDVKNRPNLSVALAHGFTKNYHVDNNLMGISKSLKYFLFNTINNVGVNPSPYDYFNFNNSSEESSELSSHRTKIIGNEYALPILSPKRGNINRNYFSSGNVFIKLNNSLNLTANYNLYTDRINLIKNSETVFGEIADSISFTEHTSISKKPLIGNAYFTVLYDMSKKSNISFTSKLSSSSIKNTEELIANYGQFISSLTDNSASFEQNLEYTNRLSNNSALKIKANYLSINQPQNYSLSPSLNWDNNILNGQSIKLFSNVFAVNSEYLIKTKLFNHSFSFLYEKKQENMMSNSLDNKKFANDISKNDDQVALGYINTLEIKKLLLSTALSYKLKNSSILDAEINALRNNVNFLSPSINLQYPLGRYDKFILVSSYDKFLPELTEIYQNYILIDHKSLSKGVYKKNVIGKNSFGTTFIHADLFNQFIYFLNVIYIRNSKSYGSYQEIHSNYTLSNMAIFPGVKNYILNGSISKYFPFLKSTLKYNLNLSWYNFYGQVNHSAISAYSVVNNSQLLDVKSGFDGWFDFEAGLKYSTIKFRSENSKNHNMQFNSNFLFKPIEKLFFSLSNELYLNNLSSINYQKYHFLDLNVKYKLNKKCTLKLIGKNITDNKFFKTEIVNQFSTSIDSYSLLPSNLLFEFSYSF